MDKIDVTDNREMRQLFSVYSSEACVFSYVSAFIPKSANVCVHRPILANPLFTAYTVETYPNETRLFLILFRNAPIVIT